MARHAGRRDHIGAVTERRLRVAFNDHCFVCLENRLECHVSNALTETAHLRPYRLTADHSFENLVLLCPNHHGDFDSERSDQAEIERRAKNLLRRLRDWRAQLRPLDAAELGVLISPGFAGGYDQGLESLWRILSTRTMQPEVLRLALVLEADARRGSGSLWQGQHILRRLETFRITASVEAAVVFATVRAKMFNAEGRPDLALAEVSRALQSAEKARLSPATRAYLGVMHCNQLFALGRRGQLARDVKALAASAMFQSRDSSRQRLLLAMFEAYVVLWCGDTNGAISLCNVASEGLHALGDTRAARMLETPKTMALVHARRYEEAAWCIGPTAALRFQEGDRLNATVNQGMYGDALVHSGLSTSGATHRSYLEQAEKQFGVAIEQAEKYDFYPFQAPLYARRAAVRRLLGDGNAAGDDDDKARDCLHPSNDVARAYLGVCVGDVTARSLTPDWTRRRR